MVIRNSNDTNSSEKLVPLFDMGNSCVYIPDSKWDRRGMRELLKTIRDMKEDNYLYLIDFLKGGI